MPGYHNVEEQGYLLLPPFPPPPLTEREKERGGGGQKALALAVEKRTISRCELSTARFSTPLIYEGNDSLIDLVPEREDGRLSVSGTGYTTIRFSTIPSSESSFDRRGREREREGREGFLREGIETRARRSKSFRGKLI